MADESSNQRHKRCHADESADQLASSRDQGMSPKLAEVVETLVEALNKRKRQRLNKAGSSKPPGWYAALAEEIDAKPSDPFATVKSDIEQEPKVAFRKDETVKTFCKTGPACPITFTRGSQNSLPERWNRWDTFAVGSSEVVQGDV